MSARRFLITGRVQGVFFRSSAKREADRLGIVGWIRNVPDGSVEAFAEGMESALNQFARWCKRGPEFAQVESVHIEVVPEQHHEGFTVRSVP